MNKKDILQAVINITKTDKLLYLNLYKGNERCTQGDLFSELSSKFDVAIEYPVEKQKHIDIAKFRKGNWEEIESIIELKHYSFNQGNPEKVILNNFYGNKSKKGDIDRLTLDYINEMFFVQVYTEINWVKDKSVINKYPFLSSYARTLKNIAKVNKTDYVKEIKDIVATKIDANYEYHPVIGKRINSEVDINLHFFICGPFFKSTHVKNNEIDFGTLPIE